MTCGIDCTYKFMNVQQSGTFLYDRLHNTLLLHVTEACEEDFSLESKAISEERATSESSIEIFGHRG